MKKWNFFGFFLVWILFCIPGCHSGNGSTQTDSGPSSISGKVMVEGYLSNARVCFDTTGDFSCRDELKHYVCSTDSGGEFKIPLQADDTLDDRAVIVEITDDTLDMGDGSVAPVKAGLGKTLMASATLAREGEIFISPLLSLISLGSLVFDVSYDKSAQDYLRDFHIDPSLNPNIDYVKYLAQEDGFVAIQLINEWAFENAAYDLLSLIWEQDVVDSLADWEIEELQTFVERVYAAVEADFFNRTGKPFDDAVDVSQIVAWAGEDARQSIIIEPVIEGPEMETPENLDTDNLSDRASGAPDPSEYQKDIDDNIYSMNNLAKEVAVAGTMLIPYAGPAISIFLSIVWDEDNPTQALLERLYKDMTYMIELNNLKQRADEFERELNKLRERMVEYSKAESDTKRREYFFLAREKAESTLESIAGTLTQGPDKDAHKFIPWAMMAYQAAFMLQREEYLFADYFYPGSSDIDNVKRDAFRKAMEWYSGYRDMFLGKDGKGGPTALFNKYLDWRMSGFFIQKDETGWEFQEMVHKYCVGELTDRFEGGFKIKYTKHNWECHGGEHNYRYSLDNIKMRLRSIEKLKIAKVIGSFFFLPKMLPTRESLSKLGLDEMAAYLPIEARGDDSFVIPDELKTIEVGPHGLGCVQFLDVYDKNTELECRREKFSEAYQPVSVVNLSAGLVEQADVLSDRFIMEFAMSYLDQNVKTATVAASGPTETREAGPVEGWYLTGIDALYFGEGAVSPSTPQKRNRSQLQAMYVTFSKPKSAGEPFDDKVFGSRIYIGGAWRDEHTPAAVNVGVPAGSLNYQLTGVAIGKNNGLPPEHTPRIEDVQLTFTFFPDLKNPVD